MQNDQLNKFFTFVYDRQLIYHKKEVLKLPSPWTEDKILQKLKFCNVYRENDKGTKYIINKVINNPELDISSKIFNIVIYRFFNRMDLFEIIFEGFPNTKTYSFEYYENLLNRKKQEHELYNNAYTVTQALFNKTYGKPGKHIQFLFVIEWLANQINNHGYVEKIISAKDPEFLIKLIQTIPLVGPFLSGQIMVDFSYCKDITRFTSDEFLVVGPGAAPGLDMVAGFEQTYTQQYKLCSYIRDIQREKFAELFNETGKNWKEIYSKDAYCNLPYLSNMNIQNSFCEFRKYNDWSKDKGKKKYYVKT